VSLADGSVSLVKTLILELAKVETNQGCRRSGSYAMAGPEALPRILSATFVHQVVTYRRRATEERSATRARSALEIQSASPKRRGTPGLAGVEISMADAGAAMERVAADLERRHSETSRNPGPSLSFPQRLSTVD